MASRGVVLTQPQWSIAYLRALGNLSPNAYTVGFVTAWGIAEGGGGASVQGSTNSCNGNMLNTCYPMLGSSYCAGPCVQSYLSVNDGIFANVMATKNGLYPSLLHALVTNDTNALGFGGHTMSADIAGDLSLWVSGSRTANLGYAAKVASLAGSQAPINVTNSTPTSRGIPVAGTTTSGTQGANAVSNANPILAWFLGTPTAAWIINPMRVIKLILGLMCVGIALFMLLSPEQQSAAVVRTLGPLLAA